MKRWKIVIATGVLSGAVIAGIAAQPTPPLRHSLAERNALCGDVPANYERGTFHTFAAAATELDSRNFNTFGSSAFDAFGRSFAHRVPQRLLAIEMAIYGYDFIGTHSGYLLFYRRPEGWFQSSSLPTLTAPNGEALPPVALPGDLDPEWPSPGLLVTQSPFIGAIVLPQQIVAIPCEG